MVWDKKNILTVMNIMDSIKIINRMGLEFTDGLMEVIIEGNLEKE